MRILKLFITIILIANLSGSIAEADFTFGTPIKVPSVNDSHADFGPDISADGLSLYFTSTRGGNGMDTWVATRPTTDSPWGEPVNLGPPVNSPAVAEERPDISADGLELYFAGGGYNDTDRPGGYGWVDLWVSTRASTSKSWGEPVNLGPTVNTIQSENDPSLSADGLSLFFNSDRPGGYGGQDIWVATRPTKDSAWGEPANLGPTVNTSAYDGEADISSNGLRLFLGSDRPGGHGENDLWVSMRASTSESWGEPVNLGSIINGPMDDTYPAIPADGSTFYFSRGQNLIASTWDIWQVDVTPFVDLNSDGFVDAADMCIIVDNWHTENTLCDVAPAPMGDGFVDVQDLIFLSEHLFEEVNDSTLIAHWALDETDGDIAQDSAGDNFGLVVGGPIWQPTGGQVNGALELDGIDDCIITAFGPNPTEGPFSILVWVKGGAAGQAVISEPLGSNWLMADVEGKLMTELTQKGRSGAPLLSQTVTTDGQWHRIGLVWDGSSRALCVDGVVVAEDTQGDLNASGGGLYIGVGKDYAAGTFFSGLIDEVRIYNRAVKPWVIEALTH